MFSRLLFESPWLLLVLLVAIQFGFISIWSWRRTPAWRQIVWGGFVAIPTLLILSVVVVTTREQIIRLCRDLATHVEKANVAAIEEHLADDLDASGFARREFLNHVERTLTRVRVDDTSLRRFDVTSDREREATAVFDAACVVDSTEGYSGRIASRWRVMFRREGRTWHVTSIEALPTPLSPIRDLRDCFR